MEEMKMVSVERIDPPIDMIRERIDAEAVRELAESIRQQGLMQPILIRPRNKRYEVVAGHRRLLAHRLIGATEIKAFIKKLDDTETLVLRATENIQRQDISPMEEAKVYGILRDELNYSMEEIARKMGRNRYTIKKYLILLKLPEYIQDYINRGVLGLNVGLKLSEIQDEELQKYYVTNAVEHGITIKVAEMWMNDFEASKKAEYYKLKGGEDAPEVKAAPTPIYVTCFMCHGAEDVGKTTNVQICQGCYNNIILARTKRS
jgi:ParB family transcriptional regulator, chromosome partitioning protein